MNLSSKKGSDNLKRTKILFGIMTFFFFSVIVTGQYYRGVDASAFEKYPFYSYVASMAYLDEIIIDTVIYSGPVDANQYANCTFVAPQERTIILRLDDLGAWHYDDVIESITYEVLKRNLSISEGVIPHDIERDRRLIRWVRSMKDNPKIEFVLHGYYHSSDEFKELDYNESKSLLKKGKAQMMTHMRVVPVTFIPPYNVYSKETEQALTDNGFKIISAGLGDLHYDENLAYLGYGARTFGYDGGGYVSSDVTIKSCKLNLDETGICIVMIHPQDYLESANIGSERRNVNETRYSDFLVMLDRLSELNASSKTYKDLLQCS